ncbi:MAG: hypothetical protein AB2L20_21530 [Mangrovibacterium sp.]
MMNKYILRVFLAMLTGLCLFACDDDNMDPANQIDLEGTPEVYEYLTENASLEIPVNFTSGAGLKKAFYKIVTRNGNTYKYTYGPEISIPVSGNKLDIVLSIPVTINLYSVVIAVYDNDDIVSLKTLKVEEVKKSPVITFKDGIKFRNTAAIGIPFAIKGHVTSEHELKQLTFIPVNNGQLGTAVALGLGNKSDVDFVADIPVAAGLEYVLIKAVNTFDGASVDTFRVHQVVNDDFINLTMDQGVTELSRFFDQEQNTIKGRIASGSDIQSLHYTITKNGTEGTTQEVALGPDAGNETVFTFGILGEQGMENLKLVAVNKQAKTITVNLPIPVVHTRILTLENIEMSTDPDDQKCFFSAYHTPHVFGKDVAMSNQLLIDWVFVNRGTSGQPCSPHAYGAGTAYYDALSPYLQGFTQLTYLFLSSRRSPMTQQGVSAIESEQDMMAYMANYSDNYNIYTSSRRVGDYFDPVNKSNGGFIIGWGTHTHPAVSPAVVQNVAWGVAYIKQVTKKPNGHYKIIFDIKVPKNDVRSANNASVIAPYDPYPL